MKRPIAGAIAAAMCLLGLAGAAHAGTGQSHFCSDDPSHSYDYEVPVVTSPVTLAIEVGQGGSITGNGHVGVCYSTTPDGSAGPETAGGALYVDATHVDAGSSSDPSAAIQANAATSTTPTYSLSPGPTGSTGDTISVSIPFAVCAGQCESANPTVNPTGLLVGQLVPVGGPGVGAGYQLSSLKVYVNGVLLASTGGTTAGVFTNPNQVSENLYSQPTGPCALNVCLPVYGFVELTGTPLLVVQSPLGTNPVGVGKTCVYNNGQACP